MLFQVRNWAMGKPAPFTAIQLYMAKVMSRDRGAGRELDKLSRLFRLGIICTAPEAREAISPDEINMAVQRHSRGDWGNVGPSVSRDNDEGVRNGWPLKSSFVSQNGIEYWVLTDADRSRTVVVLPNEY